MSTNYSSPPLSFSSPYLSQGSGMFNMWVMERSRNCVQRVLIQRNVPVRVWGLLMEPSCLYNPSIRSGTWGTQSTVRLREWLYLYICTMVLSTLYDKPHTQDSMIAELLWWWWVYECTVHAPCTWSLRADPRNLTMLLSTTQAPLELWGWKSTRPSKRNSTVGHRNSLATFLQRT